MSHQTGIKSSDDLKDVFRQCTTVGNLRLVKIGITDEKLECVDSVEKVSSSWRKEYDDAVRPRLEDKEPCYMLLQLDAKDKWLFIAYTPDHAHVRQKMLYSGTRATVKQEFGGGFIMDELIGTHKDDVTLKGYDEHTSQAKVPPPLTDAEEELKMVKEMENKTEINVATRHQTVQGLSFPLTEDLVDGLEQFKRDQLNYLQLCIDTDKEIICLAMSGTHSACELDGLIPKDDARYHIYNYKHTFGGKRLTTPIFIYTMPGYKCSIKARMLFSSCKGPLLTDLEQQFGITFEKKLEVQDEPVSEEYLMSEVHPPAAEVKEKFLKPKAPGRRGSPRRVNRPVE